MLVTGAGGFIGRALCGRLLGAGWEVRAALRTANSFAPEGTRRFVVGDLAEAPSWDAALEGAKAVVHLAARVHEMSGRSEDAYQRVNAEATRELAAAAARAGARHFVFLSSIKVNGESTAQGEAFRPSDPPRPRDAYGRSKRDAEQVLAEARGSMQTDIVRPPLVYGPDVRANFLRLMRLVDSGLPLPLASVRNRRSLVFVGNLADMLLRCLERPAGNRTLLVCDGEDLGTAELVRRLAGHFGRRVLFIPVPPALLRAAARLARRGAEVERLTQSLVVDASETWRTLDWRPAIAVDDALAATVAWYRGRQGA